MNENKPSYYFGISVCRLRRAQERENMITRYQGWMIWIVATLFVVYTFTLGTAASVFSPAIQQSLHLSAEHASFSFALFIVGFACMQLPAGYLLDRYKTR